MQPPRLKCQLQPPLAISCSGMPVDVARSKWEACPRKGGDYVPSMVVMAMVLLSFSVQSQLVCAPRDRDDRAVGGPERMRSTFPRVDISKKRYLQVEVEEAGHGELLFGRTESKGGGGLDILPEDVQRVVFQMNATDDDQVMNGFYTTRTFEALCFDSVRQGDISKT